MDTSKYERSRGMADVTTLYATGNRLQILWDDAYELGGVIDPEELLQAATTLRDLSRALEAHAARLEVSA